MESSGKIRVGPAGWSYKDWNGVFYPDYLTARKIHPLEYLAQFFDVVEINTSFYGPIKPELAKIWCRKVAAVNPKFNRKSTRLNSSHLGISYAVFCLKK